MKRLINFIAIAIVATLLSACSGFGPTVNYEPSDLNGTWVEEFTLCYWVYTLTKDDSGEYYWGKTWDEADDVHESDLEFHGNGWFKWNITNNNLVQLHMMNISEATVPKTYTVTSCDASTMKLKDTYGNILVYKKVK